MLSTIGRRTALSLPDRDRGAENTSPKSDNCPTYNELWESIGRRTQYFTDNCQSGCRENILTATKNIASVHARECASECAENECSYNNTLNCRIMAFNRASGVGGIDLGESLGPVGKLSIS